MKMAFVLVSLVSSMAFAGETVFFSDQNMMYPGGNLDRYTQVEFDIQWKIRERKLCPNGIAKISDIMVRVNGDFAVKQGREEQHTQATTYPTITTTASVECK